MYCTNHTAEMPPLKARCNKIGIHVPSRNPTPAEIIPYLEERLAAHQNHFAKTMDPSCAYYVEWKSVNDELTQFLDELRPSKKQILPENSARFSQAPPTQHEAECTDSARKCTTGVREETNGVRPDTTGAQEETIGAQNKTSSAPSDEPIQPTQSDVPPNLDDDEEDELEDDDQLGNDETEEEEAEDEELDAQLEADLDAESAGFENDAQRMAEAAEDLKAELTRRNRFDRLTAEQQSAIVALLDSHHSLDTVVRLIAKPTPPGMNFKISKSGLAKFARRYKARETERRRIQNAQASADLLDKSEDPDKAFQTAFERLLRLRLLTTTSEPDAPLETIDALTSTLLKFRKQALAERKQLHAEKSK